MKVLFAVSNERMSASIVKQYQKEYKQIISYKNVYYFNAILKELQKDKSYDRVVISEDLEQFTNNDYEQMDKFIFDRLDNISDEASNSNGVDIPIILICSERRTKGEQLLVKLFGIGIYNAIIGNDRSINEVCKLINRPRIKKEAKIYYKIDTDDVNYQSENENDVSELEIQNILAHYKKLGNNEERYVESFDSIASQYNIYQLRIISKFLPLNVRAVLEEKSPKYQEVNSFNNSVSNNIRVNKKQPEKEKTSEKLLKLSDKPVLNGPVVIPSSINTQKAKKIVKSEEQGETITKKPTLKTVEHNEFEQNEISASRITKMEEPKIEKQDFDTNIINKFEEINEDAEIIIQEPEKKKRGRPRKNPLPVSEEIANAPKKKRGRPRKNPLPEEEFEVSELNNEFNNVQNEETILPGLGEKIYDEPIEEKISDNYSKNEIVEDENDDLLPGLNGNYYEDENDISSASLNNNEEENNNILPGLEDDDEDDEDFFASSKIEPTINERKPVQNFDNDNNYNIPDLDLSNILTGDKKLVAFLGTSKNGTSFLINNLAELLSSYGVNTAILDLTKNRNAYYIYTKNEEELRNTSYYCINNLKRGDTSGIRVNKNLTVYTSLLDENNTLDNAEAIIETLVRNYTVVLLDCDFSTPFSYFKYAQELYLIQSLDILTIQPLTAFLNELKSKKILDESKIRIIINKFIKNRELSEKTIIGGLSYYNDPAMLYMNELFDRNKVKYLAIPFEISTYEKYLEGIVNCEITLKGYSKQFIQSLKQLVSMVYPNAKGAYVPPSVKNNSTFSPSMNSTLEQMKKRY